MNMKAMRLVHKAMVSLALICMLVGLFSGCAPVHEKSSAMPELAPPPPEKIDPVANPGSLFQPDRADYLFADNRATRVGDIVLVNIVEMSEATSESETTADRESSLNFGIDSFFGKSRFPGVPGEIGETPLVKAGSTNEFEGEGETTLQTQVTATVAARVVRVLPNGLMQVRGAREVRVNGENQIMAVSGLIRTRDIGPNNAISSNQLADAKIEYYGQGILADTQRPGWMTRMLNNVWPF
jgi:flagellar L-ring protein precursor FlgH